MYVCICALMYNPSQTTTNTHIKGSRLTKVFFFYLRAFEESLRMLHAQYIHTYL